MDDEPTIFTRLLRRLRGNMLRPAWWCAQYVEFVAALRFLSTLPWPLTLPDDEPTLIIGGAYFSLVGALLALLLSLYPLLLGEHIASLLLAVLLVVTQLLLTGGLHLDGLMDSCDGLFSGRAVERKLEIMRDSRVGSFGVLGAISVLLLRFAAYAVLPVHILPLVLFTVLPTARWSMLLTVYRFPTARTGGLGPAFRQTVSRSRLVFCALVALLLALLSTRLIGLIIWSSATVFALGLGAWITRVLGGLTGDTYGAIEEVTEVLTLVLIAIIVTWV